MIPLMRLNLLEPIKICPFLLDDSRMVPAVFWQEEHIDAIFGSSFIGTYILHYA